MALYMHTDAHIFIPSGSALKRGDRQTAGHFDYYMQNRQCPTQILYL